MNTQILTTNKKTKWLAAIMILAGTLIEDLNVIIISAMHQIKGSHYRELQQKNLKREIEASINTIKNLMIVRSMDKRESFSPYLYADLHCPYRLDSTFRANTSPYWKDSDLEDYTNLKWKIVKAKSNNLCLYYQDVFHIEVLRKLMQTML